MSSSSAVLSGRKAFFVFGCRPLEQRFFDSLILFQARHVWQTTAPRSTHTAGNRQAKWELMHLWAQTYMQLPIKRERPQRGCRAIMWRNGYQRNCLPRKNPSLQFLETERHASLKPGITNKPIFYANRCGNKTRS